MARIPSANIPTAGDLGTRTIQPTTDVIKWDVSHVGKGLSAVGAGVKDLAEGVQKIEEKQDEFDVANASSGLYTDLVSFAEQAEKADYNEKNPENWEQSQNSMLETRAKSIRNAAQREKFLADGKMQLARSQSALLGVHDKKSKENKLAKYNESAHKLVSMEAATPGFDNLQDTVDRGYAEIDALRADNVITDDQVVTYKQLFASDLYKNKLPAASITTRKAILEQQKELAAEGKNIVPMSFVESEMEKLKDEEEDNKALAYVTANYKGSVTGLMRKLTKDGVDSDTFAKAVNIANGMYAAADREKRDAAENAYTNAYNLLESGKASIEEVKKSPLWNSLTPAMKENFKDHGVKRPEFSSIEDTQHLNNLVERARGGEVDALKQYMMSYGNGLSKTDFKIGSDALSGKYPDRGKVTANNELAVSIYPNPKRKEKRAAMVAALTKWDIENQERGVAPSNAERLDYAKSLMVAIDESTDVDMYASAASLRASRERLSQDATDDMIENYQELGGLIGKETVERGGINANSFALGNVASWRAAYKETNKKEPSKEDLKRQYAAEVYVYDDEQQIKRNGFTQARKHQVKIEKSLADQDIDVLPSDRDAFSRAVDDAHKAVRRSFYERGLDPDRDDMKTSYIDSVARYMGKSNVPVLDKYIGQLKPKSKK